MSWYKLAYIKMIVVVLMVIGILAGMPTGAQAQSDDGLVGEWHFDGDARDSSGNGNDGTIYGATFVEGKFGKALSFDGIDDYVDLGTPHALNLQVPLTVGAWVKRASTGTHDDIVSHGHAGYVFYISATDDKVKFGKQGEGGVVHGSSRIIDNNWHHIIAVYENSIVKIYIDGNLDNSSSLSERFSNTNNLYIGGCISHGENFNGFIDEVRIYNRALSAEEIKAHYEGKQTALAITKKASPYSIKQGQTTTITLTIKNTGTTDITSIEVMDSIHPNFDLIGGDFPNPKKYDIIHADESREIQYIIKAKESGSFNLDPVIGIYADKDGNIQEVKSKLFSVKVIPSFEGTTESSSPSELGSSAVLLHGEKTDVVLGEDILLKLSAVNLITKPPMTVQVLLYPPSGMSVTGSEFVQSGAGIYTTTYSLNPGDGKDIEIHIKSNQVGDFSVKGRIVYYFGEDKKSAEDHTLTLPIKVRKEPGQTVPLSNSPVDSGMTPKASGFEEELVIIGIFFVALLIKKR